MWSAWECVKITASRWSMLRAQRLGAEIRRGVDQDVAAVVADQDRGPQAVVARIVGRADAAMAADRRHADAGARAEHRDLEREAPPFRLSARPPWPASSETCTKRNRSSVSEFSSSRCSSRLEIALGLLQQHRHQVDGVARQREVGLRLLLLPNCISPSCISACARRESTIKVKDAGGSGICVSSGRGSLFSTSLIRLLFYNPRSLPAGRRRGARGSASRYGRARFSFLAWNAPRKKN